MCSGATLMSRLKRVCYAVPDPKMGCLGGATDLNALARVNHHVELTAGGVLEEECRVLLQAFFKLKRAAADDTSASGDAAPAPPPDAAQELPPAPVESDGQTRAQNPARD